METADVLVRPARESDLDGWLDLYEAVATEGRWIGGELPIDRQEQRRKFLEGFVERKSPAAALIAVSGEVPAGHLFLTTRRGIGEIGMAVDHAWRNRGVGTALMAAAVDWARAQGLHKVTLQLWPHNVAARRLYDKFGFVEEGYLRRHYRRRNGELWDAVVMGLVLDTTSPGSPL